MELNNRENYETTPHLFTGGASLGQDWAMARLAFLPKND
jgi:hypothetical protein